MSLTKKQKIYFTARDLFNGLRDESEASLAMLALTTKMAKAGNKHARAILSKLADLADRHPIIVPGGIK